jgi:predicted metal-dependent peptidase
MQVSSPVDVENKILKARIALALRQPFLASTIMRLPIKDATLYSWCPTMATDGYHIFFNATWVESLTISEIRGVLAHEVLHVIFQHGARRAHRDPTLWNIAADHAINLLLQEQGFLLPRGGFANPEFRNMSTEQIYALLPKNTTYRSLDTTKSKIGTEESEFPGKLTPVGVDVLDPDNFETVGIRDKDMPDKSQLAELCEELRVEALAKLQGTAAGYFSSECQAIEDSKIDWREVLRSWLVDRIKSDWSMWPYSKKHIHRGFFLPSVGIEAPGHIVFAIDTSGSMSDEDLGDIFTEIRIYRETFPCKLTVIQADAAIQTISNYEELDGEEIPKKNKISGRGGTDFRPVFSWIDSNCPGAYLIYATDGYGTFPKTMSSSGLIWILVKNHADLNCFPFGTCVKL